MKHTVKQVLDQGPVFRHERGSLAKLAYLRAATMQRFNDIIWSQESRKIDIRAAIRRYRKNIGMPLSGGLPAKQKYRLRNWFPLNLLPRKPKA